MRWPLLLALTTFLMGYLCLGAWVFQATEGENEQATKEFLVSSYVKFIDNHTCVTEAALRDLIKVIVETGGIGAINPNASARVWDFAGAFTFAVTVVTTIGYGKHYPSTTLGRGICVVYALIGIPLTLIVLGGIGEQFSRLAQKVNRLKLCSQKPTVNKGFNVIIIVLSGLVIMFVLPSLLFNIVEGWSVLEAIYYCFITLSTIGFGDYIAGSQTNIANDNVRNIYRIGVYIWILLGLSYLSLVIKYMSKVFIKKAGQAGRDVKRRVGSHRISINEKRKSSRRERNGPVPTEELCGNCKRILSESVSSDTDNDVHLVSISSVQLHI